MATIHATEYAVVMRRRIAPGELELLSTAFLNLIAALALFLASPRILVGNGTALLTAGAHPDITGMVKSVWALVFAYGVYVCMRAVRKPSIKNRRVAWNFVIPLWGCWVAGLSFPLFIGQQTNIIVLAISFTLINQWLITRLFVPPNASWYDREVNLPRPSGEGS